MSPRSSGRSADSGSTGIIYSMTGFGKSDFRARKMSGTVEIRSFNHRFLKIAFKLPSILAPWEPRIEKLVRDRIARGSLNLTVKLQSAYRRPPYTFDPSVVEGYVSVLRRLKKEYGLEGEPSLDLIAGLPETLVAVPEDADLTEVEWKGVRRGILAALDRLVAMRATEGEKLQRDILRRGKGIEKRAGAIRRLAPKVVAGYQKKLHQRLRSLLDEREVPIEAADLAREIAFFADRSDISEEIERLASHLAQFDEVVHDAHEAGRRLEFILHEMFREVNTIGSKANDAAISRIVVEMKAEIEKIREQVQNIE
jgi:uncharacterized protein (TIGR00255 family)